MTKRLRSQGQHIDWRGGSSVARLGDEPPLERGNVTVLLSKLDGSHMIAWLDILATA